METDIGCEFQMICESRNINRNMQGIFHTAMKPNNSTTRHETIVYLVSFAV